MRDAATWRKSLFDEIRTIASRSEIERLWSGKDPLAISSYQEEVAHVFDDFDADGFIAMASTKNWLDNAQLTALRDFRDEFASYVIDTNREFGGQPDYQVVLADPRWTQIMSLADTFISLIDRSTN
jgi:hypothetical protein